MSRTKHTNILINFVYLSILLFVVNVNSSQHDKLRTERSLHTPSTITENKVMKIASMSNNYDIDHILDKILVPRVVGTRGHGQVRKYITSSLKKLGWDVEIDSFEEETPIFGKLRFHNIIARLNPNAKRYLTLACHYDSKYFKNGEFLGATDSAVPCAQLIDLAHDMSQELNVLRDRDLSLMLLFFDGEEAFQNWGPNDSIYGAKHLATKWDREKRAHTSISELEKIDILVLLDLIGAPDANFYNYFQSTEHLYSMLVEAEKALANKRQFRNYSYGKPTQRYFQPYSSQTFIEDDHIPFLRKNVSILHLIPTPFPEVWHTIHDNRDNLDMSTVENISAILRLFVATYLQLDI